MEEEPNEHELEERLYAMLHHVDETQENNTTDKQNDAARFIENAPRSTLRRYWRTSGDYSTAYQKVNAPKEPPPPAVNKPAPTTTTTTTITTTINSANDSNPKPKEEKSNHPPASIDLSLFQSPPQIVKRIIEILDHEPDSVLLESSDEDEVIEVELPPKPTITIESSDEDEVCIVSKPETLSKTQQKTNTVPDNTTHNTDREVSASPVPSVVSSVSDEFIRSDCIALNISSRRPDNHCFDFSLHGSDLLGQVTPSKKKKKKKSKEAVTSTPVPTATEKVSNPQIETCFATPKSKAKNKRQRTKSYTVSEKSVPSADVYDSDSNQSAIETVKEAYGVTEKSLPSTDVYESDSSQPDNANKNKTVPATVTASMDSSNSDKLEELQTNNSKHNESSLAYTTADSVVDLTEGDQFITLDSTGINENIVMANVSGFKESSYSDYNEWSSNMQYNAPKLGSTKVPQILFDNLDFDNLKGKDKVCKGRRYSLTTLRAEMEKFYNESWGGEDFNHREIQKYMSRDKSLWVIDPKDRMPALSKRKVMCNYCNRAGHRDDACRMKPPVCYMCGNMGHYEPRCPSKICVNCGSPNNMYSTMCRNCMSWNRITCAECGQHGHPASHCPDVWRRYHNTIDTMTPLMENRQMKKNQQLFCSGCARRGHLVHTCRFTVPFSGLPINSPYVALYRPVYKQDEPRKQRAPPPDTTVTPTPDNRKKRQSKSPTSHETHLNKRKTTSISETPERPPNERPRKNSQSKTQLEDKAKETKTAETPRAQATETAPDFIPLSSNNHDNRGQMIQDNEVSDTSDVVTSARIYITDDMIAWFKTTEGEDWLKEKMQKCNITMSNGDITYCLNITGKFADQESFQAEIKERFDQKHCSNKENLNKSDQEGDVTLDSEKEDIFNIPKNRHNLLRKLTKALESLKNDLGDPKAMWNELNYLQNHHENLLKKKVISPIRLRNNRRHINETLQKLNMVLLGQAGLADGPEHLKELHLLQEKLTHFRQKNVSRELRKEVSEHFHTIFTAVPRSDYAELLKKYYVANKQKHVIKNNMQKPQIGRRKRKKQKMNLMMMAPQPPWPPQTYPNYGNDVNERNNVVGNEKNTHSRDPIKLKVELADYHKRVMKARPVDVVLKKTRVELCRKLHVIISSLVNREQIPSKTMKKVKKIHLDAQTFLSNV